MADKVNAWKSSDGRIHETEEAAKLADVAKEMSEALYQEYVAKWGKPAPVMEPFKKEDASRKASIVIEHARVVFDILSRHFGSQ